MKRKWLFRGLALFLVGGICWLLIGVTINFPPKSPRQKLEESHALWQSKGIKDYQMDVTFASMSQAEGFRLVIHDNQVTAISEFPLLIPGNNLKPLTPDEQKLNPANYFGQKISLDLKQYTVDSLFDIAATKVSNDAPLLAWCSADMPQFPDVRFNADYGYIESYDLGNCPKSNFGGGLMCPAISDCWANVGVRNFQLLPPS